MAYHLIDPASQRIQPLFAQAPRCHSQRLPHLLRLLLMYQDNLIPATPSGIIFLKNSSCTAKTAFLTDFRLFFSRVEAPGSGGSPRLLVGGERSGKGDRPFMAVEKALKLPLPCAAGPRAAEWSALNGTTRNISHNDLCRPEIISS